MIQPNEEILRSIKNLSNSNPESFNRFVGWVKESLVTFAMSISEVEGDEKTNIMKGRIQILKHLDLFLSHTDRMIESSKSKQTHGEV